MIVRRWTGAVPHEKADAYLSLMRRVAIPDYRRTAGNIAALCLHADRGDHVEVEMLTCWKDMDAVRAFAGAETQLAKYYDFDADYLISLPREVTHAEVEAASFDAAALMTCANGMPS